MKLPGRSGLRVLGLASPLLGATALIAAGCYDAGTGTAPPLDQLYYPVGLGVSAGGNVLYVANSDFDLQWSGGTIQSYDLRQIRELAAREVVDPNDPAFNGHYTRPVSSPGSCPYNPPLLKSDGSGERQALGETCAPPVDNTFLVRDSVVVGAFATDLQLSCSAAMMTPSAWPNGPPCPPTRLFVPVRGDATLTWVDVGVDDGTPPLPGDTAATYPAFALGCGRDGESRCDALHHAGNNPNEAGNTRNLTMPGEPFGMAQTENGSAITITHQATTQVSLFTSGFLPYAPQQTVNPALQYIVGNVAQGGIGIAAIPHDSQAFGPTDTIPNPAFLLTNRTAPELDLLRYYPDEGDYSASTLYRPFPQKEESITLTTNSSGSDSRGLAIDSTPRIRCKQLLGATPTAAQIEACARHPARVFISDRAPETLIIGEVGEPSAQNDGTYDPDALILYQNVPLTVGPSRVYLAPIVDSNGNYALRVFIVCFDSASIAIYDPSTGMIENIIRVGDGPYAMAFDPFTFDDVAAGNPVPPDPAPFSSDAALQNKKYRFAYVASFTNSFIQAIDLDNSRADKSTFENVALTFGQPTAPKGTN